MARDSMAGNVRAVSVNLFVLVSVSGCLGPNVARLVKKIRKYNTVTNINAAAVRCTVLVLEHGREFFGTPSPASL